MNLSTLIILVVLEMVIVLGAVVRSMIQNKKAGKGCFECSGCVGDCGTHQDVHSHKKSGN